MRRTMPSITYPNSRAKQTLDPELPPQVSGVAMGAPTSNRLPSLLQLQFRMRLDRSQDTITPRPPSVHFFLFTKFDHQEMNKLTIFSLLSIILIKF